MNYISLAEREEIHPNCGNRMSAQSNPVAGKRKATKLFSNETSSVFVDDDDDEPPAAHRQTNERTQFIYSHRGTLALFILFQPPAAVLCPLN